MKKNKRLIGALALGITSSLLTLSAQATSTDVLHQGITMNQLSNREAVHWV